MYSTVQGEIEIVDNSVKITFEFSRILLKLNDDTLKTFYRVRHENMLTRQVNYK